MNGGHYTALSKVEEIILNDVLKQRYSSTNDVNDSELASPSTMRGSGAKSDSMCFDDVNTLNNGTKPCETKLSLNEFIAATSPVGAATLNSDTAGGNKTAAASRWLKFDDEFVNVVPAANLHTNIVTGQSLCSFFYLLSSLFGVLIWLCYSLLYYAESAVLLFYQRKNMSSKNLIQYL